jgi:enterobacterial common antigen flippase
MAETPHAKSHGEALKSSALIGGSTAIILLIRMVRTKVLAILLGPVGIGLEAIFDSITSVAKTCSELGVSNAGVRQIAASVGTGNRVIISKTIFTLRRVCMLLGAVGAGIVFVFREPISQVAFGSTQSANDVGLLSIVIFCGGLMSGQLALLQGMRRIKEMAMVNILGTLVGAGLSIPMIYLWGRDGIAAYLAVAAIVGVLISWSFARRIKVEPVSLSLSEFTSETRSLLKLGIAFASSGLMTVGALFLIRILVAREEGIDGAGQFQAASALSMVYIGFILQSMGTDFYPRLAAASEDDSRCNQLVNEQGEVSLLLGLPGILATIALAPWMIQLFYSSKFSVAGQILCWQAAGMLLRVGSWPMGFIVMAKGRSAAFFWTEFAAHSTHVILAWIGLKTFGLPGTGMAFLGLYLFHWCMMYLVVRKMTGFRWSTLSRKLMVMGVVLTALVLIARLVLNDLWATGFGCVTALIAGVYCLSKLVGLVGEEKIERFLGRWGFSEYLMKVFWNRRPAARAVGE